MPQYQSVITLVGQGKIADAIANGPAVNITQLSAGDGNGAPVTPLETQSALVHEVWRGNVLSASRDPSNPTHVIVQAVIPVAAGPFTIRELALWTADGQCFAVMNTPEIVKTTAAQGATQDITVSFRIVVDTAANITVNLDPAQLTPVSGLLRAPFIAIDGFVTQPPVNPAAGALYVAGAAPTGAFAALAHKFVQWNGTVWLNALAYKDTIVGDGSTGLFWKRTAAGWEEVDFNIWIKADATYTVGVGQAYETLPAALAALRYKLIAPDATVTLLLTGAQHAIAADINIPHLNGARLIIKGQALAGAFPTQASCVALAATTLATLRGLFPTELLCAAGVNGIVVSRNACVRIENLLITGQSATAAGIVVGDTMETALSASNIYGPASATIKNVWCHGHGTNIAARQGGFCSAEKLGSSHASGEGVLANNLSYLNVQGLISCRNGASGIHVRDNARAEITGVQIHNNATGISIAANGFVSAATDGTWNTINSNTGLGVSCTGMSGGFFDGVSFANSNNGAGSQVQATVQSRVGLPSCTGITTISPAANAVGNQNSYIWA